ncbi:MAG: NADPH2:quinone reductase [Saprospiraceae bacterium]|jgi:NADPH2:quinone reductase
MKAIRCVTLGGPQDLELQELPNQELGVKEVRVKIEACSVNFPETLIIQGLYQFKPDLPFTPGSDIAGVITEVGPEVKHYKVGMQVFGVVPTGGYADQVVANQREVFPLPQGMNSKVGSTFMMAYGTSYYALKQRAKLQAGETLVILGASGGVGLAAVELGKHMGARVIACASTDEKLALCKAHGADETINYTTEDLKARVKELTGKKGADVIYDAVGGAHAEPAVRSLAWEGRYLVVGFVGGIPKIPLNLLLLKGAAVVGVFWGSHVMREPQAHQENMMELMQLYQEGKIKPHIDKEYSLADAPQALQDMMDRKVKGKVIIVP